MSARTIEKTPVPSLVVFASGRGSNFRALCEAVASKRLSARIEALVCNVAGAACVEVASEHGITVLEIESRGRTREAHEAAVLGALEKIRCDWIVLAGYMRLFTREFIGKFHDPKSGVARIVNIHPSLLPAFPGVDAYGQALRYGVKVTGCTVHFIGEGLDDGPIVAQSVLDVRDDDTEATLSQRGLEVEHNLYITALRSLFERSWRVDGGPAPGARPRVIFEPSFAKESS